jgi:hypothetical protein
MHFTQSEFHSAIPAVRIGVFNIRTPAWKRTAKSVLQDLEEKKTPDLLDLKHVLTVVTQSHPGWVGIGKDDRLDIQMAQPLLEKLIAA